MFLPSILVLFIFLLVLVVSEKPYINALSRGSEIWQSPHEDWLLFESMTALCHSFLELSTNIWPHVGVHFLLSSIPGYKSNWYGTVG
jgi:hypothetical protein